MSPLSRFRLLHRGGSSAIGGHPPPQLHSVPPQPNAWNSPTPESGDASLSRRYTQMAQDLRPSMPPSCYWLGPGVVELVGELPIGAGGFTDIYEVTYCGRRAVLKSYRCYITFDVAQVAARFRNEVHTWTLLYHKGVDVVPLGGVYSTEAHPFGLIYEYADGLDLKQYLRNEPNADRLELLTGIAQALNRMHDLGVVHGNLCTVNILIDKDGTTRIAGLGDASIPSCSTAWTTEGGASVDRLSRNRAPETTLSTLSQNPTGLTKASDMYAFGVMAWEVLTGRPPFFEMTEIAATYNMLNGTRPPRPSHREISDGIWDMIERCWDRVPSKRISAGAAVDLLETEARRT